MCSLRLGAVFVRVYGLGFDDAFLVMRCCFISVFPPPEEALFLYLWNFQRCMGSGVCMSYLTCIRGVHIPGAHLCCGSRDVYMYNIYVERERERGMVCVFVCMCVYSMFQK